jgi:hypothetical protein
MRGLFETSLCVFHTTFISNRWYQNPGLVCRFNSQLSTVTTWKAGQQQLFLGSLLDPKWSWCLPPLSPLSLSFLFFNALLPFHFFPFFKWLCQRPSSIIGFLILVAFPLHPGFSVVPLWTSYCGPWRPWPSKRLPLSTPRWIHLPFSGNVWKISRCTYL